MTIAEIAVPASYQRLEMLAGKLRGGGAGGQVQVGDICGYCDGLLAMGLAKVVEGFFGAVQVNHPQWAEYQRGTRARLGGVNSGLISWSSRQRRYAANMAVLARRWPEYEALLAGCEANAGRYQLHLAKDGNYQLRDTADPNPLDGWLGGLKDQKAQASLWKYQREKPELPTPVAFDGVGFGWLLLRVLETTRNTYLNYSPAVYVVEPDVPAFWMLLHLHDLREWLEHPRLRLFLGPAAGARYRAFLAEGRCTLPDISFTNLLTRRGNVDLVSIAGAEFKRRGERTKALREEIDGIYADRTPEWWERRFAEGLAGGRPLRIVGITSRFTTVLRYSMEELAQAIRAAGHEFHLSIEADDATLERNDLGLIREVEPDLLIQISRMRHEMRVLPARIPFLCWDQDYLPGLRTEEAKGSLDAFTYVAGHAASYGYHERGWPARNCVFCHLAAATHRYSAEPAEGELRARYACDFSYVSNASEGPRAYAGKLGKQWEGRVAAQVWAELADRVIEGPAVHGDAGVWQSAIAETAERHGQGMPATPAELALDLVKLADRRFRHEALGWVAEYCRHTGATLKLYGSGWEGNAALAHHAAGPIEPGASLRALYQGTKINLQLILSGFLHGRSLDGIAAGGFFLTRKSAGDYDPDPRAGDFYALAHRATELGIWNFPQLLASTDPAIVERRPRWGVDTLGGLKLKDFVCFHVASGLPAAATVFADIPGISFRDAEGFGLQAARYLGDAELRAGTAARMRGVVAECFSYDARVGLFLRAMARGFTQ